MKFQNKDYFNLVIKYVWVVNESRPKIKYKTKNSWHGPSTHTEIHKP